MATHEVAVRNGLADYAVDLVDGGTPPGKLSWRAVAVELAVNNMSAPNAYGDAAGGTATANAIDPTTIATAGTCDKVVHQNNAGTDLFTFTVTASGGGGEVIVDSVNFQVGVNLTVSSMTYTASP